MIGARLLKPGPIGGHQAHTPGSATETAEPFESEGRRTRTAGRPGQHPDLPICKPLTCAAIIRIRLKDHAAASVKAFRDLVARMNEVTLCVMLTGEADYLVKIVARDLPHFQEIVQSKLLRCAAIQHMESSIVLEHLKDTTELPLDD